MKADNRKSMSNIKVKKILNELEQMRETMNSRCSHQRTANTMNQSVVGTQNKGFNYAKNNQPYAAQHDIPKVTLVATNDYTKNISSFIFSPSLDTRPQTANRYKTSYQTPKKEPKHDS